MRTRDPFDFQQLAKQIKYQRSLNWDIDHDVPWDIGVDPSKQLLPLEEITLLFPDASSEQLLALSQWVGLVINATISEMEDALPNLRKVGWKDVLDEYSVNPEMYELGEMFFEDEHKHSLAFKRYQNVFCQQLGVDQGILSQLMPKAYGSFFQSAITSNAAVGGHIFWWVVAEVEEVSITMYKNIHQAKEDIDPLYYILHRKHLEEEARHENYAHLMLNLLSTKPKNIRQQLHKKVDFIVSQLVGAPWVVAELSKFFKVKDYAHECEFFKVLASCVPLYEKLTYSQKIRYLFMTVPYISWMLHPTWGKRTNKFAHRIGALTVPNFSFLKLS